MPSHTAQALMPRFQNPPSDSSPLPGKVSRLGLRGQDTTGRAGGRDRETVGHGIATCALPVRPHLLQGTMLEPQGKPVRNNNVPKTHSCIASQLPPYPLGRRPRGDDDGVSRHRALRGVQHEGPVLPPCLLPMSPLLLLPLLLPLVLAHVQVQGGDRLCEHPRAVADAVRPALGLWDQRMVWGRKVLRYDRHRWCIGVL